MRSNTLSAAGRALRLPLRLLPGEAVVRVVRGPLRGMKWIAGAHTHGCWLGTYESRKQALFAEAARRARVVYDLGAHVGFYTLAAARHQPAGGHVYAFEPHPRNLSFLRRHLALNRAANATVIAAAVADRSGRAALREGPTPATAQLAADGTVHVPVVALDEMVIAGRLPPPELVKIDVEGADPAVLRGAERILRDARPTLFLATHGDARRRECESRLRALRYRIEQLDSDEFIARPD